MTTIAKIENVLHLRAAAGLAILCLAFTSVSFAQNPTGTINGVVTDPSGAVVPGANITRRRPMASRAQITEILPETLPGDFVEWDVVSPSTQSVQSVSSEPGPENGVVSKRLLKPHRHILPGLRREKCRTERQWANAVGRTRPSKKKWPIVAGASATLLLILGAAIIIPAFNRDRVTSVKPADPPAPAMATIQQPEDAAPTHVLRN